MYKINERPIIDYLLSQIKHSELIDKIVVATTDQKNDDIIIHGENKSKSGGFEFQTCLDHRMAMSALVMGLISRKEIKIDNSDTIKSSFPNFHSVMLKIKSKISKT